MAPNILVVDDDPDTLTLVGMMLERRGFTVWKAIDGATALARLEPDPPDLVILDVMMPVLDGFEVCRRIKANPRTTHIPVILLTARAEPASQLEGLRAGAIDYITKPVHPQDLLARIQSVLNQASHSDDQLKPRIIAVSGAKGGIGATTLAVNLAVVMAARVRTILIDLVPGNNAALHLGLHPSQGLKDLIDRPVDQIDPVSVITALTTHSSGLRLLAAADDLIDPDRVTALLNQLLLMSDVCVIDLGWGLTSVARTIAQRCTSFVLALDSDRVTLMQANRVMQRLAASGVSAAVLEPVWINRSGLPSNVAHAAIQTVLGRLPSATIDADAEAFQRALEFGQPLVFSQPDLPAAVQMHALAEALMKTHS
jgi:CheY-like chemotaxis protein/MinD-like ATPase involved in chromosome partitioning or flagellar assembly